MRANVSFGTEGETILQHGFGQKIAEPRHAAPTILLESDDAKGNRGNFTSCSPTHIPQ
jgi:hypothetical protein